MTCGDVVCIVAFNQLIETHLDLSIYGGGFGQSIFISFRESVTVIRIQPVSPFHACAVATGRLFTFNHHSAFFNHLPIREPTDRSGTEWNGTLLQASFPSFLFIPAP
jgi:hypothetical protein